MTKAIHDRQITMRLPVELLDRVETLVMQANEARVELKRLGLRPAEAARARIPIVSGQC